MRLLVGFDRLLVHLLFADFRLTRDAERTSVSRKARATVEPAHFAIGHRLHLSVRMLPAANEAGLVPEELARRKHLEVECGHYATSSSSASSPPRPWTNAS